MKITIEHYWEENEVGDEDSYSTKHIMILPDEADVEDLCDHVKNIPAILGYSYKNILQQRINLGKSAAKELKELK